jgi:hypothetical protein
MHSRAISWALAMSALVIKLALQSLRLPALSCRLCQTNVNRSQFSSNLNLLGFPDTAPLSKSGGAVQLEM